MSLFSITLKVFGWVVGKEECKQMMQAFFRIVHKSVCQFVNRYVCVPARSCVDEQLFPPKREILYRQLSKRQIVLTEATYITGVSLKLPID